MDNKLYSSQTGRFPVTSSCGHKCILILYDYASNAILAEPLVNRSKTTQMKAYKKLFDTILLRGIKPQLHFMDNEASTAVKNYIKTIFA